MRPLRAFSLLLLLISAFAVPAAAAQSAPRSTPDNDNFAQARQLIPGTSVKVKDPSAATVEGGEPSQPCAGVSVRDSIWFKFTPARGGTIHLSIAGTKMVHPQQTNAHAALTVYSGTTLGALSTIDCNYSALPGWRTDVTFAFAAGGTYYIELSQTSDIQYAEKSFYKLTSRLTSYSLLPANYGFEGPIGPDNWKLKNGTNDTAACGSGTHPWIQGECAFKFTPGPDENASLSQTVNIPSDIRLRKNGVIFFYLYYNSMESPTIENAKVTATLVFSDGTPSKKFTLDLSGLEPTDFDSGSILMTLPSASLNKVKIKITYKSSVGALVLDNIAMLYEAGASTRGSGSPLALPMSAQ